MRIKTMGMAALLLLPALPGAALAQSEPEVQAAAPAGTARPATPAPSNQVVVRSARRADHSRLALDFPGAVPAHTLIRTTTGYDLRFPGRQPFNLGQFKPVADLAGVAVVRDGPDSILRLTTPCPCEVELQAEPRRLRLLVRRGASPDVAAAPPATAPLATPPLAAPPQPAAAAPAPPAAVAQPAPAAAAAPATITLRTARRPDHARLALDFPGALPPVDMRITSNLIELRLRGAYQLNTAQLRPLAEVASIGIEADGRDSILRIALDCICAVTRETSPGTFHVLLRRTAPGRPAASAVTARTRADPLSATSQAAAAATPEAPAPAAAATPPPAAPPAPRGRQRTGAQPAPTSEEVDQLRNALVRQLGVLNGTIPPAQAGAAASAAQVPGQPVGASPGPQAAQGQGQGQGQAQGQAQAGSGTAGPAPAPSTAPQPPRTPAAPASAPPGATPRTPQVARSAPARPACAPDFDAGEWGGSAAGSGHADRLVALRAALAISGEAPDDAAALAEFLVGQGLLPEALDLLRDRISPDLAEVTRLRLQRVRDVARLLQRRPIDPNSPLLAEKPNCEREDLALWQALAAAAQGDAAAIAPLLPRASRSLRAAPDRLRLAYVFALAEAVQDDVEALRSLAAPIRNATPGSETEEAGRNLLLARIAALSGARDEERLYLRRAAQATRSVPGLYGAVRLAARDAERPGAQTPESKRAEEQLIEMARTYRHDRLGEEASVLYAGLLLGRDNLPGALLAADAASSASGRPFLENRGAALAARILRLLLVDPEGRTLPPAEERLAMFWGFEGYATPGERGDDIRMGAARLMLERDLPDAALEVVRELSAATARTPAGALLIARAEALAPEGDAQKALAILRAQDLGEPGRRAAAQALARLNRPSDAANELGGLRDRADLTHRGRYLFLAQRWTDAANAYAELLRDPSLDAAQRGEATGRYATAAALSPRPIARVPAELLAPADSGTRSLLLLQAHEPAARSAQAGARIDLILNAIDRAKRIEAMATTPEAR